jgi:hypothetical protein
MLVRHSLCNLQRCAFIVAFTSEKRWMIKSLFRNLQLIPNTFSMHLPIRVRCKSRDAVGGSGVRLTEQLATGCLIANYCKRWRRWRHSFKGPSQDGGWADFSKNLRASLFNDDLQMSLISAGSISLDIIFKLTAELDSVTLDSPLTFGHCVEKSIPFLQKKQTPLHLAASAGQKSACDALISLGRPNIRKIHCFLKT